MGLGFRACLCYIRNMTDQHAEQFKPCWSSNYPNKQYEVTQDESSRVVYG